MNRQETTLVLGGTGKTGRRVAGRLRARGLPARAASRSGDRRFDWEDRSTWAPAVQGGSAAYVSFFSVPGGVVSLVSYLFTEVLEGRNARLADGAQRALGREPRDLGDYARRTAAASVWDGAR